MKNYSLSLKPQDLGEHDWYYEECRGVVLVHEVISNSGEYIRTDQIRIPWAMLRNSVQRKYGLKRPSTRRHVRA